MAAIRKRDELPAIQFDVTNVRHVGEPLRRVAVPKPVAEAVVIT